MNHMANDEQNASSLPNILPDPRAPRFPEDAMAGQEAQASATAYMPTRPRGLTIDIQVSEESSGSRPDIEVVQHGPVPRSSPISPIGSRRRARGLSVKSQLSHNAQDQHEARATGAEDPTHHAHSEDIAIELAEMTNKKDHKSKSTEDIPTTKGDGTIGDKKLKSTTIDTLPNYTQWTQNQGQSLGYRAKDLFHKITKKVLRINEIPPSKDGRHIQLVHVGQKEQLIDERTGRHYVNNTIRSSRYTLWTFLPRQLIAQFSKLANL